MQAVRAMASADYFVNTAPAAHVRHTPRRRPGAWIAAKMFTRRLDGQLACGATVTPGSALDVHARRLVSMRERHQLAESLTRIADPGIRFHEVPVARARVLASGDLMDEVRTRLLRASRLRPRGVATLRLLLSDGAGPFYRCGSGDLRDQLRAVLAAM